ncbi:hypothetical protein 18India_50 [Salmonella phage 18-India]|nr:hypothetical protein 18India_50 [Salmonella phage 18-India]
MFSRCSNVINTPQLKGGGGLYGTARGIFDKFDPEWKPRFRD